MKQTFINLELSVNNHPGVMMHVVSLFARRAFNLDGILCMPCEDTSKSKIWLRVRDDETLPQIQSQLNKLHDVIEVEIHPPDHAIFDSLERYFLNDTSGGQED